MNRSYKIGSFSVQDELCFCVGMNFNVKITFCLFLWPFSLSFKDIQMYQNELYDNLINVKRKNLTIHACLYRRCYNHAYMYMVSIAIFTFIFVSFSIITLHFISFSVYIVRYGIN